MSSKIDKFCNLLKGIEFKIKREVPKPQVSQETLEMQKLERVLVELNKAFARAKTEFNSAKKMFKQGKLSATELFEFEIRMVELRDEIARLKKVDGSDLDLSAEI
jgi:hypothetical protein